MFNLDENIYILEKNDNVYFDFLSEIKTKKYDSIQFETDDIALRFVRILVNNNIKVPEDIAVIGFDNLDILNYGIKKLTTIDHKSKKLCKVGVEKLVGQINGEKIEAKTVIKPSFINGETTWIYFIWYILSGKIKYIFYSKLEALPKKGKECYEKNKWNS